MDAAVGPSGPSQVASVGEMAATAANTSLSAMSRVAGYELELGSPSSESW
jgi:hypothetical protein